MRIVLFVLSVTCCGFFVHAAGLDSRQIFSCVAFAISVGGTLFFWEHRLSFAFLGVSFLVLTKTVDLAHLVAFSSLDVILFLIGMMIVVGLLKEAGFFAWIVELILRIRNLTAKRFVVVVSCVSALLSATTGEVVSIVFMTAAIFEICDYFEVDAFPYVLISVFATNIGSAATVLGNPIGILIAARSGLTSEDFLVHALPAALACLGVMLAVVLFWHRKSIADFDRKIKELGANEILIRLISVPIGRPLKMSLFIFGGLILLIGLSHRIEVALGLENNAFLLTAPLIVAALIMMWRREKASDFVEKDVEWRTLLFFMLLFAQAGALKFTHVTDVLAAGLVRVFAHGSPQALFAAILWMSSIGSSILDNVVLVAAFIPMLESLESLGLGIGSFWWALLFGGCLGGNITLVGSTANIIAVGIMEKEKQIRVRFREWLGCGLVVGAATTAVAWLFFRISFHR